MIVSLVSLSGLETVDMSTNSEEKKLIYRIFLRVDHGSFLRRKAQPMSLITHEVLSTVFSLSRVFQRMICLCGTMAVFLSESEKSVVRQTRLHQPLS